MIKLHSTRSEICITFELQRWKMWTPHWKCVSWQHANQLTLTIIEWVQYVDWFKVNTIIKPYKVMTWHPFNILNTFKGVFFGFPHLRLEIPIISFNLLGHQYEQLVVGSIVGSLGNCYVTIDQPNHERSLYFSMLTFNHVNPELLQMRSSCHQRWRSNYKHYYESVRDSNKKTNKKNKYGCLDNKWGVYTGGFTLDHTSSTQSLL